MAESPKFRFGVVILVAGTMSALVLGVVYLNSHALAQDQVRPTTVSPANSLYRPPVSSLPGPMNVDPAEGPGDPFVAASGPLGAPSAEAPPPALPGTMGSAGGMMGVAMEGRPGDQYQNAEREYAAQARELLKSYVAESNPHAQAEQKKALRESLIAQFDLQHRRRDEELKWIEKRVAELRLKLQRRADAVNTIVDRRLEQLISDVDGLGWGADDLPQDLFEIGMSGSPVRGRRPAGGMIGPGMSPMRPGMGSGMSPMRRAPPKVEAGRPGAANTLPASKTFLPEPIPQPGQPVEPSPAVRALPGSAPATTLPLTYSLDDAPPDGLGGPPTQTTVPPVLPPIGPSPTPAIPEGTAPSGEVPSAGPIPTSPAPIRK
jgi:hypothetical protein